MLRRLLHRLKVEIVYTNVRVLSTLSRFREACIKRAPKKLQTFVESSLQFACLLHVAATCKRHAKAIQHLGTCSLRQLLKTIQGTNLNNLIDHKGLFFSPQTTSLFHRPCIFVSIFSRLKLQPLSVCIQTGLKKLVGKKN
jgi:hypothetical protein